jgi:hypothetical protein
MSKKKTTKYYRKDTPKTEDKPKETKKSNKVEIKAINNTTLANGKFVKKGDKVEVSREYAERIKQENNKHFKIIN